jgi:hypothetical protein
MVEKLSELSLGRFRKEIPYIDLKIRDLATVLNELGFETSGSCEGHLRKKRHPYPWVTYIGLEDEANELTRLIEPFNDTSDIRWITHAYGSLEPDHKASTEEELRRMRESGKQLAKFLRERYLSD